MATLTTVRRRWGWRGLATAALVCGVLAPVHGQRLAEYQVKAAFLQSFARFVEWPAPPPDRTQFAVCVLGDDPFGAWLDEVTAGTTVKDQPVVVRRLRQLDTAAECQTLFIAASEATRLSMILDTLRPAPVLTVSDLPQFAQRGGMIGFTTEGSRVRFVANPDAAKAAGLQLSSALLRVASAVLTRPAPKE